MTPYPSDEVVAQWAQTATIVIHIREDGSHVSKRAQFVVQQAIDWHIAQQSDKDLREFTKAAMTGLLGNPETCVRVGDVEALVRLALQHAAVALEALKDSAP